MTKTQKSFKQKRSNTIPSLGLLSCVHFPDRSEIHRYSDLLNSLTVIADVYDTVEMSAKAVAEQITLELNSIAVGQVLLVEAGAALEECMRCEGKMTWELEQELSVLCQRIKSRSGT